MNWFHNLPISRKLMFGFLFVGAFTVLLGLFSIDRLSRSNNEIVQFQSRSMPAVQAIGEIRAQMGEFRTFEMAQISRADDKEAFADYTKRMSDTRSVVEDQYKLLNTLSLSASEKDLLDIISNKMEAYLDSNASIQSALKIGDVAQAQNISDTQSRPQRRDLFEALKEFNTHEAQALAMQVEQSQSNYTTNIWLIVAVLGGILLVSVVLSTFIAKLISRPVQQAVQAAVAVSNGDFSIALNSERKDEVGNLIRAMGSMSSIIQNVIASQRTMDEQHRNGMTSYRIDGAQYQGAFKDLVEAANSLVDNHIEIKMTMVAVLERYAQGDFAPRMRNLPNEQAKITNAMETARENLLAINGDIQRLVQAASNGDFTARGDTSRYNNDFRVMVENLNSLMSKTESNLQDIAVVLNAVAQGDLTVQMNGTYHGVFERMQSDANQTVAQLLDIVTSIQEASQSISTAASEISVGNNELSARTEQQAANLEETAASMEELTSTVRQNADNAVSANTGAGSAYAVAENGQRAVGDVVEVMQKIERSAFEMRDIVGVIDRLTFQTNILSLNAAVEAARAGDSGKGFAVVAGEIRALAQSSAQSAKDIRTLIDTSTALITQGAKNAHNAGNTIDEVRTAVGQVREKMEEISLASREQSAGIEQVNTTVVAMDEVTQQNAAMVEEAAAAARSLEEQSQILLRSVGVFKTSRTKRPVGAPIQKSRVAHVAQHNEKWVEF